MPLVFNLRTVITAVTVLTTTCIAAALPPVRRDASLEQTALDKALYGTPAVAVVLDGRSGHILATHHREEAGAVAATPGSILKPLVLLTALQQHVITPKTAIFCRRELHIGDRNLPCTHPQSNITFTAEDALAYSCNTYFADLANRIHSEDLVTALRGYHLGSATRLVSPESSGTLTAPNTTEEKQLLVLGLSGVTATPLQIAVAYRRLTGQVHNVEAHEELRPVATGLRESVQYGMAHNADVSNVAISGKTGTASNPGQSWTHGWFAGFGSVGNRDIIVVIYIPHGNGADAATFARLFFTQYRGAAQ